MIHLQVTQGSIEWFKARLGIPTASEFDRIITPKTLKLSAQAEGYMHEKLSEWMTGEPFERETHVWAMDVGIQREQEAADYYELTTGRQTVPAGFCLTDDRRVGASPDRLVGEEGLLEIKCPLAHTHVAYLLGQQIPSAYVLQTQGQLLVTGRAWCDFLSYYPGLPPFLVRSLPDPKVQGPLQSALADFLSLMEEKRMYLQGLNGKEGH
jgi:putative phage-type endonuclease